MKSGNNTFKQLNTIALGIEVQFDPLMVIPRATIQKTRSIAQEIGSNDSTIKRWGENKHKQIENGINAD